jgi:hypothetical protein
LLFENELNFYILSFKITIMNKTNKLHILLAAMLTTASFAVRAQLPGVIQRIDFGYSYSSMSATYNGVNQVYNPTTNKYKDSTVKKTIMSTGGIGGSASTFIPCRQLGEKSMLAISIGYNYNAYQWGNVYNVLLTGDGASLATTNDFSGLTVQLGAPISLDVKFGNEAFIRKNERFCATVGAGAYTSFSGTAFKDDIGTGFGVQPFLKGEMGVLGGIVFKIRAVYAFGNFDLIDQSSSLSTKAGEPSKFTLTSNSSFTLSLVFDPFAWNWKKEGWWDR